MALHTELVQTDRDPLPREVSPQEFLYNRCTLISFDEREHVLVSLVPPHEPLDLNYLAQEGLVCKPHLPCSEEMLDSVRSLVLELLNYSAVVQGEQLVQIKVKKLLRRQVQTAAVGKTAGVGLKLADQIDDFESHANALLFDDGARDFSLVCTLAYFYLPLKSFRDSRVIA